MNTKEFKELISAAMIFFILITAACNDNEAAKQLIREATQQDKENEEEKAEIENGIEQYIEQLTQQYTADKTFKIPYEKPADEDHYKTINAENSKLIDNGWKTYGDPLTVMLETFVDPKQGKPGRNRGEWACTVGHGDIFNFAGPYKNGVYYIYECSRNNKKSPMNKEIMFQYKWGSRSWFLDQLKLHLKIYTLPRLRAAFEEYKKKCEDAGKKFDMTLEKLPPNKLWALLFVGVQREEDYPKILERLFTKGITKDDEVNAFLVYSGVSIEGALDRRYWLGLLYAGKITIDDVLTLKLDKFSILEPKDTLKPVDNQNPSNDEKLFMFYDVKDKTYKKFKTDADSIEANKNKVATAEGQTVGDYLQKVNNDKNDDDTKKEIFAYLDLATQYLKAGKYNEAIQVYEDIVKIDKNKIDENKDKQGYNETVYKDLETAVKHIQEKQYVEAMTAIETYVLNTTHISLYTKAHCCYLAGIIRDAQAQQADEKDKIEAYEKATNNFVAAYNKIQTADYKEAKDKAEKNLEALYRNKINNIEQTKIKGVKYNKNPLAKAIPYYDIGQIYEKLAKLYINQNRFDDANKQFELAIKDFYTKAVDIDKNNEQYKEAKIKAGIEIYMTEIEKEMDNFENEKQTEAELYYNVGQIREELAQFYKKQNNIANAKVQFRRAIKNYNEAIKIDNNNQQYKKAKDDAEKKLNDLNDNKSKQTSFINATRSIEGMLALKRQHNKQAKQTLQRYK